MKASVHGPLVRKKGPYFNLQLNTGRSGKLLEKDFDNVITVVAGERWFGSWKELLQEKLQNYPFPMLPGLRSGVAKPTRFS